MQLAVSVIITTYNRADLLKKSIQSILDQTFDDFEIIIINNYSTDDTLDIISVFNDDRIKVINFKNNGIIAKSRNYGIRQSVGKYISFCDDDDLWEPSKLEVQLQVINNFPEYKVVCANGIYFSEKGIFGYLVKRKEDGEITLNGLLSGKNDVILSSVLVDRKIFSKVGLFNENPEIFSIEDYELWVRITKKYRIYFINNCLIKYRVHELMSSHKDTRKTVLKEKKMFLNLYENDILGEEQYNKIRKNLEKKYRKASFKELFKRYGFIKSAVYLKRKIQYHLSSRTNKAKV